MTTDVADEESEAAAYRRLWASVIVQSLIDATAEPKTPQGKLYKRQARAWLLAEAGVTAQNFEEVCLAADIEPTRVRAFVRKYEGPPLSLHALSRMRNHFLSGGDNEDH